MANVDSQKLIKSTEKGKLVGGSDLTLTTVFLSLLVKMMLVVYSSVLQFGGRLSRTGRKVRQVSMKTTINGYTYHRYRGSSLSSPVSRVSSSTKKQLEPTIILYRRHDAILNKLLPTLDPSQSRPQHSRALRIRLLP